MTRAKAKFIGIIGFMIALFIHLLIISIGSIVFLGIDIYFILSILDKVSIALFLLAISVGRTTGESVIFEPNFSREKMNILNKFRNKLILSAVVLCFISIILAINEGLFHYTGGSLEDLPRLLLSTSILSLSLNALIAVLFTSIILINFLKRYRS